MITCFTDVSQVNKKKELYRSKIEVLLILFLEFHKVDTSMSLSSLRFLSHDSAADAPRASIEL